jgi:hypothetical protein
MAKTDGKTVQLKELPEQAIRIFRNRDAITVLFPEEVRAKVDGAPLSIDICPMSHREAELRKRIIKGVSRAEKISIRDCGVNNSEYVKYLKEAIETNKKIFEIVTDEESEQYGEFKHSEEDREKFSSDFEEKWERVNDLLLGKDDTGIYRAQDDVLENSVEIVAKNCDQLNFEDGTAQEINSETIEYLHPDLFKWVLSQIEDISYLRSGEILGL